MINRIIEWLERYRDWYWKKHYTVVDWYCATFGHKPMTSHGTTWVWFGCKRCGEPLELGGE